MSRTRETQLRQALPSKCSFEEERLVIAGRTLNYLRASSLDDLLDEMVKRPDDDPDIMDERLPYWAEVWPASLLLARHLLSSESLPADNAIELGCGPGLAGIAASLRDVGVLFTDYVQEALTLSELNFLLNSDALFRAQLLDWRHPPAGCCFPWIIASDIAYEARNFSPILSCFDALLSNDGEIWFAEAGRPFARPFFDDLVRAGWTREILCQKDDMTVNRLTRAT